MYLLKAGEAGDALRDLGGLGSGVRPYNVVADAGGGSEDSGLPYKACRYILTMSINLGFGRPLSCLSCREWSAADAQYGLTCLRLFIK